MRDNRTFTEKVYDFFSGKKTSEVLWENQGVVAPDSRSLTDKLFDFLMHRSHYNDALLTVLPEESNRSSVYTGGQQPILDGNSTNPPVQQPQNQQQTPSQQQTPMVSAGNQNTAMGWFDQLREASPLVGGLAFYLSFGKIRRGEPIAGFSSNAEKSGLNEKEKDLFAAVTNGDTVKVQSLLKEGVNPNITNEYGESALQLAAEKGSLAMVDSLLDAGADVNKVSNTKDGRSPLLAACERGDGAIVGRLLEAGADARYKDEQGKTAMHYASDPSVLGGLIARGADINAEDLNGRSPLHDMVAGNHFEVIEKALGYGADPNKADIHGRTALQMAALNGNDDILKVMRQAAAMDEPAQQSQPGQERAANAAAYLARFSEPVPAEEIEVSRLNTQGREG